MVATEVKLNANAVVTNSQGNLLLVRLKKGPFAGGLCIPGGGVHPGELSWDAAKREVLEETGINVSAKFVPYGFCELMSETIDQHKIVMLLQVQAEGLPSETEEGSAGWYNYETIKDELIPFAKEALRIFYENERHFTLLGNNNSVNKQ